MGGAVKALDEFGNADHGVVTRMPECAVSFRLNDLGQLEFERFGDHTEEFIMETCYPQLQVVLAQAEKDGDDKYTASAVEQIRFAVRLERNLMAGRSAQRKKAGTEAGRIVRRTAGARSKKG
jgi:hypothetical protein